MNDENKIDKLEVISPSTTEVQFEAICPKCGDRIFLATNQWWRSTCMCGIEWKLEISATGKQID